ncbi:glycosyltransferase family 4 protein [Bacteroidota bacterium]
MNIKKLRVVWLCHFTNDEVQAIINPRIKVDELSPWIPSSYKILQNDQDIELHIISPHKHINNFKKYLKDGIYFYFYNAHMPIFGYPWPKFFKWDYISNFRKNKRITRKLVNNIHPEIIHLHGAENAYYSSSILQFIKEYPTILTVQGFISKTNKRKSIQIKKKIHIEHLILKKLKSAFYRTETMAKDLKIFNPDINLYWGTYPTKKIIPLADISKKYDLVFFARVSKDKGIEDLLKAVAIIKIKKPDITLCVIGSGKLESFQLLAKELGISENVIWAGFLPTQADVHKLASQARIIVLPTYHDIISGTIIESLFLKIPVVAYNVGSIHEVNKHEEIISLVKKLDVEGLAKSILDLLNNEKLQEERAEKGYKRAMEMFSTSNEEIKNDLLKAYNKVIENFQHS